MSSHQPVSAPANNSMAMIRTLTLVAMLSGFLVVLVVQITAPMIAENQRRAIEAAIFQVIPGAEQWQKYKVQDNGIVAADAEGDGVEIYAGYTAEGKLKGIAAEAASQGYADVIKLLFGYNPECQCITGKKVLKTSETPGLGD